MIENMAIKLVDRVETAGMINRNMREIYIYSAVSLFEKWLVIGTMILIGFVMNHILDTIIFMLFFFGLRKRTGGYHADKFWQCYIYTILTYAVVLIITPYLATKEYLMMGLLAFSAVLIFLFGTVNHPNMELDSEELKDLKKMARYTLCMELLIIAGTYYFIDNRLYVAVMSISVILCALLLVLAKILKQEARV